MEALPWHLPLGTEANHKNLNVPTGNRTEHLPNATLWQPSGLATILVEQNICA
jgi:hypothetical protein